MYMLRPDGQFPQLNDGESRDYSPQLAAKGRHYGRQDFIYVATNGREGTPPADTSHRFPWIKRAFMRGGWDEDALYAFLETAPLGAGHVHEDALTFEIYAHGTPLIGTMGRLTYERVPKRHYLVNSRGHNTVLVDGNGQFSRSTDPDRSTWIATGETTDPWISTPELDVAWGRFAGPWEGDLKDVVWERSMAFHKPDASVGRPGLWVLKDMLQGAGEHELRTLFHFFPGEIEWDESTARVVSRFGAEKGNVLVGFADPDAVTLDCARGQDDPPRGWYSECYGKIEPAWEVAAVRRQALPCENYTVMVPFLGDGAPEMTIERSEAGVVVILDGKAWPVDF